jgi:transcriptional regulator with GAF, ATPase, and Fis domain
MARISLKRLIGRKKEAASIINHLVSAMDTSIGVKDADEQLLLGVDYENPTGKYPVELEGETLGWVIGGKQAAAVASLLTYLASKEAEKKTLAIEVLDRYRELNLIYDISEKLASSLELKAVAKLAIDEAKRLITASGGSVMLHDEQTGALETLLALGQAYKPKTSLRPGEGIVGSVALTGKGEIVNDVWADARFIKGDHQVNSLVCAPLKAKQRVIGVIIISSEEPITYTAADLKLLNTIASQAAPAIENALFYEKNLKEAREREEKLKQQIMELHIELSEARQARQVAEITETEYFQRLQAEAQNLRDILEGPSE